MAADTINNSRYLAVAIERANQNSSYCPFFAVNSQYRVD